MLYVTAWMILGAISLVLHSVQVVADASQGSGLRPPLHGLAGSHHQGHASLPAGPRQPSLRLNLLLVVLPVNHPVYISPLDTIVQQYSLDTPYSYIYH